ncbi:hypothetical protein [Labedella endophytica]|uniref:Aldose 1-epimerase n=1 Tax=Labedella endophytica TaxID=1523160 RepID=A0A433JWZ1_9MICO|nr:hypothetical protein [Labedella endophytica]RUR03508.1 hypothetical protein ELQ94_02920 [Labedella endophytica]
MAVLRHRGARAVVRLRGAHISSFVVVLDEGPREALMVAPWAPADGQALLPGSSTEWHRTYSGGWHPLIPRPLGPAEVDGIDQPYHGEAAWIDWRLSARSRRRCELTVALRTVPLRITRRVELTAGCRGARLALRTVVSNYGVDPALFGWGEHPTLSAGLFDGGVVTVGSESRAVTDAGGKDFFVAETGVRDARVTGSRTSAHLTWRGASSSHVYVWQERGATRGFPWYGRADALAIEPASQAPDLERTALGPLRLGPGESMEATMSLRIGPTSQLLTG